MSFSNHHDYNKKDEECELLLQDSHLEIHSSKEFWKSIHSLSLQEKALYHDVDYSVGRVSLRKEKRLEALRHMRRISYILFFITLIVDYAYTMYKAVTNSLWNIVVIYNVVFSILVFCLISREPLRLLISAILVFFVVARLKSNRYRRQYHLVLSLNTSKLFMYSIVFFFFFYFFDQIIEFSKGFSFVC